MKYKGLLIALLGTVSPMVAQAQTVFIPYTGDSTLPSKSSPIVIKQHAPPVRLPSYSPPVSTGVTTAPVVGYKPGMPGVPEMVAVSSTGGSSSSAYDPDAAYMGGGMVVSSPPAQVIQDKAYPDNGYIPSKNPQTNEFWNSNNNVNHPYTPNRVQSIVQKSSGQLSLISWDFIKAPVLFNQNQVRFTLRNTYEKTISQVNASVEFVNLSDNKTYTSNVQNTLNLSPNEIMTLDGDCPSELKGLPKNMIQATLHVTKIVFSDETILRP